MAEEPEFTEEELVKMALNEAEWIAGNPAALTPKIYRNMILMKKRGML
jgi:hypothetical protein